MHLPNSLPTDLADKKILGTNQDASNLVTGNYYKSKKAWPWALNFAGSFDYPAEGNSIDKCYNYFLVWAKSGGTLHTDWYLDTPANRNNSLIYHQ